MRKNTKERFFKSLPKFSVQRNRRKTTGKTGDLLKKIRDRQGTFHAKVGTIKDRNYVDLTKTDDIKKMLKEFVELYRKILMTQITTVV